MDRATNIPVLEPGGTIPAPLLVMLTTGVPLAEPRVASIRASILDSIPESDADTADCTIDWRPDAPRGDTLTTVVVVALLVEDEPCGVTVVVAVVEGPLMVTG